MSLTFENIVREVQNLLSDKGGTSKRTIERFVNMAQRDIAGKHDWPNLLVRDFVSLVAPYTTGTVSTSTTTVTGVGTTFTSGMEGRKFAKDYNSPWYEIATFTSSTVIVLADDYAETDLSGATYVIYEDRVSMPANCEGILGIWLHDTSRRIQLDDRTESQLPFWGPNAEWGGYVRQADKPYQFAVVENDSTGALQIQLGPYAPDSAYRLEVIYRKDVVDGTMGLLDRLAQPLINLAYAYCAPRDHQDQAQRMEAWAIRKIEEAWAANRRTTETFRVGQMTSVDITDPAPFYVNYRSLEGQ
ncbi:MAG: hypothetical protein GY720_15895 [bacterium]|nr:hypothetical protein [bacterium]